MMMMMMFGRSFGSGNAATDTAPTAVMTFGGIFRGIIMEAGRVTHGVVIITVLLEEEVPMAKDDESPNPACR